MPCIYFTIRLVKRASGMFIAENSAPPGSDNGTARLGMPQRADTHTERRIISLRANRRWGPHQIGAIACRGCRVLPGMRSARAARFADDWAGETYEKGEAQTFWTQFLEVFGVDRRRAGGYFEYAVKLADANMASSTCSSRGSCSSSRRARAEISRPREAGPRIP